MTSVRASTPQGCLVKGWREGEVEGGGGAGPVGGCVVVLCVTKGREMTGYRRRQSGSGGGAGRRQERVASGGDGAGSLERGLG